MLEACKRAKIKPARHSTRFAIRTARALAMRGVPMAVIAEQLGHADTRMTEKHYAHLALNYVADTIRAHFPTLGIAGGYRCHLDEPKKGAQSGSVDTGGLMSR
jgi:hypothetical protein